APSHHPPLMRSPFFINSTATTEIYTLSLHDALPIFPLLDPLFEIIHGNVGPHIPVQIEQNIIDPFEAVAVSGQIVVMFNLGGKRSEEHTSDSSHVKISYAVFCLKKKKKK